MSAETIEAERGGENETDPYELLEKAEDAMKQSRPALAAGLLNRINSYFGSPLIITSAYELQEAVELAGFGQVRMILVDTGLGMPGERGAAE